MSSRIPTNLVRVAVVDAHGQPSIEYVDRPPIWEEIAYSWRIEDIFGRCGMVLRAAAIVSLIAAACFLR